jgi:hypothetical protein
MKSHARDAAPIASPSLLASRGAEPTRFRSLRFVTPIHDEKGVNRSSVSAAEGFEIRTSSDPPLGFWIERDGWRHWIGMKNVVEGEIEPSGE